MISARLHDYVVKDILHELVRADPESVRFWHKADCYRVDDRHMPVADTVFNIIYFILFWTS
ncbi:hypothetical protein CG436_20945 [Pantoea ananatis]|nr:hypothetical protein CG436_20945 [Pantoea ananatis]